MNKNISKKDYRCHAHTNAFKDNMADIPETPEDVNWSNYFINNKQPTFIDIGCGYGKFLMKTAEIYSEENVLGLEIRQKVYEFVNKKTEEMDNCSVIRTNALFFLPNYFKKNSLKKIFVLFPDPHFKKKKQKGRVICKQMMGVFKYLLQEDGELYISTDVKDLFTDMCQVIEESNFFKEDKNREDDVLFEMSYRGTDEAGRAGLKSGCTFGRVYKIIN